MGEGPALRCRWPHCVSAGNWGPAGSHLPSQPGCPGVRAEKWPDLRDGACLGLCGVGGGGIWLGQPFCPRVLGTCGSWGGFSAWPADLEPVTGSHWASISSSVKWGNSSSHLGVPTMR